MSVQTDAPPLPPPKDIPKTLRLGTNLLGLGIGPFPSEQEYQQRNGGPSGAGVTSSPVVMISSSSTPTRPPKPTHFVPLRTTSPAPLTPPQTARPSSPYTTRSDKGDNKIGERYHENSKSSSTVSLSARSTCTITPPSPSARETGSAPMLGRSPSREWGWKRSASSSERIERPLLNASTSFGGAPSFGRKRSSGQLLSGLGKGLGRMGSVMRRNTSDAICETPGNTPERAPLASRSRTWGRKGKGKEAVLGEEEDMLEQGEGRWPSLKTVASVPFEEGDAGITRPYNVEHDLHVSPSLEDLPPAWLDSLRAQGLTEQDLMLIASARKRQQAVSTHAISPHPDRKRSPHLSEPPKSIHSMPMSVGGSSANLVSGSDEWRRRGTSTPETGITSFNTSSDALGDAKLTSGGGLTAQSGLLRPESSARLLKRFSFEPSSTDGSIMEESNHSLDNRASQTSLDPAHDIDMNAGHSEGDLAESVEQGQARPRTARRAKRMSDKVFSRFDIAGAEGWAANLLSVMNAETTLTGDGVGQGGLPSAHTAQADDERHTVEHTSPASVSLLSSTPAVSSRQASNGSAQAPFVPDLSQASNQDKPTTANTASTLSRTTFEAALDPPPFRFASPWPSFQSWSSPRPPRPAPMAPSIAGHGSPVTPCVSVDEAAFAPLRKSSDSFGVHYSQSKSSVELDLVTPSSSSHPDRRESPPSSDDDHGAEDMGVDDGGSVLDFAGALREGGFDYTPGSSVSKELKEYLPGLFDTPSPSHRLSRRARPSSAGRAAEIYTPRIQHDKAYSVPTSVSSCVASRSVSPDLPPYPSPHARASVATTTKEERTSAAYSVMSSDSGHLYNSLHEATVQTAYTKVLGKLQEEADRQDGRVVFRRGSAVCGVDKISEESDHDDGVDARMDEDGKSEAGHSAIHALDEAARRFADVHV